MGNFLFAVIFVFGGMWLVALALDWPLVDVAIAVGVVMFFVEGIRGRLFDWLIK